MRAAGDADADRDERDVLHDALAILDPDEPCVEVLGVVEVHQGLVELLGDPLGDGLGRLGGDHHDEVVAADVADEANPEPSFSTTASWMMRARRLDQPVAADEALLVVVGLEVVEVAVEDRERARFPDLSLDLLLDPDVAGQAR